MRTSIVLFFLLLVSCSAPVEFNDNSIDNDEVIDDEPVYVDGDASTLLFDECSPLTASFGGYEFEVPVECQFIELPDEGRPYVPVEEEFVIDEWRYVVIDQNVMEQ